jgi:hypothetical protein
MVSIHRLWITKAEVVGFFGVEKRKSGLREDLDLLT